MNADIMTYLLIGMLLVGGYLMLLRGMLNRKAERTSNAALAFVLLILYSVIMLVFVYIIGRMGDSGFILTAFMALIAISLVFISAYGLVRYFPLLNKKVLALFVVYMLALAYMTIFSRPEGHSREILLHFDSIHDAISLHSLKPLRHMFLNVVLFVPVGILIPLIYPEGLEYFLYIAPLGMMLSTLIEGAQMLLHLGQCDLEDILANTLGAVVGLILLKLFELFFIQEEDEEDEEDEEEA